MNSEKLNKRRQVFRTLSLQLSAACTHTVSLHTHFTAYPRRVRLNNIYYSPQHVNTTWFVRLQSGATEYRSHFVLLREARMKTCCCCFIHVARCFAGTHNSGALNQPSDPRLPTSAYNTDILRNTLPYF